MLKTDLYSAIKSEDSEALDSGTSQLGSGQPEGVWWNRNVLRRFLKTVSVALVMFRRSNALPVYLERRERVC